jgi:hypothetical protein
MNLLKTTLATLFLALALTSAATSAMAGPNCTCRFAGQNFETGQVMCIRGKLSRCEFVLNNTSWKTIAETCPQSKLQQSPLNQDKITTLARIQSRFAIK